MNGALTFTHLTLEAAERELVGACIDHESALLTALRCLPEEPFRSHLADELRVPFYAVAGWYAHGSFDGAANRNRLAAAGLDYWWMFDELWCPLGMVPAYIEALCSALVEAERLQKAVITATERRLYLNPLATSADLDDAVYLRLQAAIILRRQERQAMPKAPATPQPDRFGTPKRFKRGGVYFGGVQL